VPGRFEQPLAEKLEACCDAGFSSLIRDDTRERLTLELLLHPPLDARTLSREPWLHAPRNGLISTQFECGEKEFRKASDNYMEAMRAGKAAVLANRDPTLWGGLWTLHEMQSDYDALDQSKRPGARPTATACFPGRHQKDAAQDLENLELYGFVPRPLRARGEPFEMSKAQWKEAVPEKSRKQERADARRRAYNVRNPKSSKSQEPKEKPQKDPKKKERSDPSPAATKQFSPCAQVGVRVSNWGRGHM